MIESCSLWRLNILGKVDLSSCFALYCSAYPSDNDKIAIYTIEEQFNRILVNATIVYRDFNSHSFVAQSQPTCEIIRIST